MDSRLRASLQVQLNQRESESRILYSRLWPKDIFTILAQLESASNLFAILDARLFRIEHISPITSFMVSMNMSSRRTIVSEGMVDSRKSWCSVLVPVRLFDVGTAMRRGHRG